MVKQATYNIGPNSKWPVFKEQCENYSLGNELYEGIDVDRLYSWVSIPWKKIAYSIYVTHQLQTEHLLHRTKGLNLLIQKSHLINANPTAHVSKDY